MGQRFMQDMQHSWGVVRGAEEQSVNAGTVKASGSMGGRRVNQRQRELTYIPCLHQMRKLLQKQEVGQSTQRLSVGGMSGKGRKEWWSPSQEGSGGSKKGP